MLRRGVRTFKEIRALRPARALLATLLLVGSACYWTRYDEVMEVHLEVLSDYGAKLAALAADGRKVPVQDWGEFIYPAERARDFARIAAKRYPDRRSLSLFRQAVERYGELVESPEILRRADELRRRVRALERAIEATRRALAEESGDRRAGVGGCGAPTGGARRPRASGRAAAG